MSTPARPRFDFALSFAGSDRAIARSLYAALIKERYSVFIDEAFEHEMIGTDGMTYLGAIYAKESRYCIVLLSEDYDRGTWTQLERETIRSRELLGERGVLIPVKLTSYAPDWLPASRIYFDLSVRPIENLLAILRAKHTAAQATMRPPSPSLEPPASFDISGLWISKETVGGRMARDGTMNFSQTGVAVDGIASLVEQHPDGRALQYQLALHGEALPAHRLVRFVGTMVGYNDASFPRPYSVDSFAVTLVEDHKLVGTCLDERGLRGEVVLTRRRI